MLALGATVEARRIDRVPSSPQAVCHRLPNPAALVRAVDQNERRHCAVSFLFLNAGERARLSRTKPLSALQGGEGGARRGSAGRVRWAAPPSCASGTPHPALSPRPAGRASTLGRPLGHTAF